VESERPEEREEGPLARETDAPGLEILAEDFRLAVERELEADRLFDHHEAEAQRQEKAYIQASRERIARRVRLIRGLLEAGDVRPDKPEEWSRNPSPVCHATIGDRLYVVARNSEIDPPGTLEEMANGCTLVIVPVETKGGAL
jgi:hypothetical protein